MKKAASSTSLPDVDHTSKKIKKRKRSRERENGNQELTLKKKTTQEKARKEGAPSPAKKFKGQAASLPDVDHSLKKLKKRKRSRENGNQESTLKKKTSQEKTGKEDAPSPAKKFKGQAGSELTRKERRNKKKNCSKKNKFKHLTLNKSSETTKASSGFCGAPGDKDQDSDDVSLQNPALETDTVYSTKSKGSGHMNSMKASSKKPESADQQSPQSQKQAPLKLDKKRKTKGKKQKQVGLEGSDHVSQRFTANHELSDSDEENNDDVGGHDPRETIAHKETAPKVLDKVQKSVSKQKAVSAVDKAREKLSAARFRYLNEQLYTSRGEDALKMFQDDPEAFQVYHQGFQQQVSQWPVNPLDVIIKQLGKMKKNTVVADFGCGDARLAESLSHNVVHSFDLVSTKPCVTACDIAKVPLENSSVGVAVFCLSLMGSNLSDYLREANRVLQKGGLLKVAEVISRFYSISRFVNTIEAIGFEFQKKNFLNKMFMLFTFKKVKDAFRKKAPEIKLKACYYKRR